MALACGRWPRAALTGVCPVGSWTQPRAAAHGSGGRDFHGEAIVEKTGQKTLSSFLRRRGRRGVAGACWQVPRAGAVSGDRPRSARDPAVQSVCPSRHAGRTGRTSGASAGR